MVPEIRIIDSAIKLLTTREKLIGQMLTVKCDGHIHSVLQAIDKAEAGMVLVSVYDALMCAASSSVVNFGR